MTPAQRRALEWLANGRTGASSKTLCFWLAFEVRREHPDHPHDPADLDRCLRFLTVVPEARPHLPKIAELSPEWAALVARWDDIERSHLDEVGLGWSKANRAPKTYALMRSILHPETQPHD